MERRGILVFTISVFLLKLGSTSAEFGPWGKPIFEEKNANATKYAGIWLVDSVTHNYYDKFPNEWRFEDFRFSSKYLKDEFSILSSVVDLQLNKTETQIKRLECKYINPNSWVYRNQKEALRQMMTVLEIDYENYAIVDICKSIGIMHWRRIEILKRSQASLPSSIEETKKKIESYYKTKFSTANQDCFNTLTKI